LKLFAALIVGIVLFSLVIPAKGEIEYLTKEPKFSRIPTVCLYEPDEPRAREPIKDEWVKRVEKGIKAWQYALMEGEDRNRDEWRIDIVKIPLEKQENFDNENCSVEVKFTATRHPRHPGWVGWERFDGERSQITIFYMAKEICGYNYDPELEESKPYFCYVDEFKRSGQMGNIAAHEFGHSMGLGHYVSSSARQNYNWSFHPESSPSIMTYAIHYNEELNQIKQIDVDKVKEIYQNRGFGEYVPFEFKEKEPDEFEEPKEDAKVLKIGVNQRSPVLIEGVVPEELIIRGTPVEFQIKRADGSIETGGVIATKSGQYQYPFNFDSKLLGNYEMVIKYNDEIIDYHIIEIVDYEVKLQKERSIPEWVKQNARWWSGGQIEDSTFLNTIQFLVNEKIIDVSGQVTPSSDSGQNKTLVPSWVKNSAGWWAQDKIPEEEFLKGIKFLIENGIIQLSFE